MKTFQIEVQRIKSMAHNKGLVQAKVDATVQTVADRDDGMPTSTLTMTEENARVLLLLIKQALAEIDGKKARSQR